MLSDEEIESVRAKVEEHIGPTHAAWYAEACRMEYGHEPAGEAIWACRVRECLREWAEEVVQLREELARARAEEREACVASVEALVADRRKSLLNAAEDFQVGVIDGMTDAVEAIRGRGKS